MATVKELKAQAKAKKPNEKKKTKKQQVEAGFDEIQAKVDKSPRARKQRERLSDIWGENIVNGNLRNMLMKRINKGMKPMAGGIMNLMEVLGLEIAKTINISDSNAGYKDLTPAEKKASVSLKKRTAKKSA